MWGLRLRVAGPAIALLLAGSVAWMVAEPSAHGTDSSRWPSPLLVEATGHEFQWRFRYAGRDGVLDTADDLSVERDLHLPVDADVELRLTSDDYIYSLSIPELDLLEMAVPNLDFELRFRASRAGAFELLADPMCSVRLGHDELMGRVLVRSQQAFDEWVDELR